MNKFIPFALPDIGDEEINEVVDCMRSGWITTGPRTRQFEKEFSEFIGNDAKSLAVNSATAGLHLAVEACGIGAGDEVITTPYTFTSTAEIIRYMNADPVFVDIEPNTMNIDPSKIESSITSKTKAIIPVHFAGLSCNMDAIIEVARKHNLIIIEDAAHALPSTYNGNMIGSLESDVTIFSFYANKTMTTAEGGMLVTKNEEIAKRASIMRLHGIDRDAFDRYNSKKPSWYYEIVAPGFKYNMTDIAASMGIHQLRKTRLFQKKRQIIADYYKQEFKDLPVTLPVDAKNKDIHSWHIYPLRLNVDCGISRDEFIVKMSEHGIGTSVHFIPLHIHPYWKNTYNLKNEDYPIAYDAYLSEVTIPNYSAMKDSQVECVAEVVKEILKK